ncbi:unnamed protein product, partial [Linum tenue]
PSITLISAPEASMDSRLANTWRPTVNEKKFIETALASNLRIDDYNRKPIEYRQLTINFGRQLVQPYRERPNEGTMSIFTEFSPMADPSFELGSPGEAAIELGRMIDRGLRNLIDAANVAALAALLTFRRPECSLGGENGQEVVVHPPEVKDPLPLIVHHLPIAVTFGFFSTENTMVLDPTHSEEAVMAGRMTVTVNASGGICAIQKAGGVGVPQREIMRCLRLASQRAGLITKTIKDAVEVFNKERASRKIKRHSTSVAATVSVEDGITSLREGPHRQGADPDFTREDGSADVQLGHTHVMGFVSSQLVQPYRERPNEGTMSIFTEFSPMADPSFELGRPGESAIELGRIIDRGLRESRAVDMESLCVLAGKLVWAIRIDLHILDNGGNLVDAANVAALAALLTFRRPECSLGGENGQEVVVHPPEAKDPLPLIVHHLPIAVTFGFFSTEYTMVVDPTHSEEAVMGGRMTVTVNASGDICAIQKAGGVGVPQSEIMRCLRLASDKAESITKKIKDAVEAFNTERMLRKIKRHSTALAANVSIENDVKGQKDKLAGQRVNESSMAQMERLKLKPDESSISQNDGLGSETRSSDQISSQRAEGNAPLFLGGPSSWDPHTQGVDPDFLKASLAAQGKSNPKAEQSSEDSDDDVAMQEKDASEDVKPLSLATDSSETVEEQKTSIVKKTLKDAVKPKNRRRKKTRS